jgi:hypothetical protein
MLFWINLFSAFLYREADAGSAIDFLTSAPLFPNLACTVLLTVA